LRYRGGPVPFVWELQAEGVIEIKQRGPIRVLDVGRLNTLGAPEELIAQ
jgi:hypothetical protein